MAGTALQRARFKAAIADICPLAAKLSLAARIAQIGGNLRFHLASKFSGLSIAIRSSASEVIVAARRRKLAGEAHAIGNSPELAQGFLVPQTALASLDNYN